MAIASVSARSVAAQQRLAPSTTLSAALTAAGKQADRLISRLDKDKDGYINKAELEPLVTKLDKLMNRLSKGGADLGDVDPTSEEGKKSLAQARAKMNDADRLLMAVGQLATEQIGDGPVARIGVKVLQKGVRAQHKDWVNDLKGKGGGIEGAIGMMSAGLFLPTDVLQAALEK